MVMVTKQQLIDAGLDADTLEAVVNGAASPGTVTSRLGANLRTILKVIADLEDEINTTGTGWLALAEDWATKVNGIVDATDYSAKAWSIGGTGVTDTSGKGAAKEWATETASTVDTTEFSAKEYAQGTQAATGGSAKSWATKVEDSEVTTGKYSSLHYAAKAAAQATIATTAAGALSSIETNVFLVGSPADATGVADGSTVLQTQIDAMETLGGGIVSTRNGYLNVGSQITIKKHVTLRNWLDERTPMRQATADSDGVSGGVPNSALRITHGTAGLTTAASATFILNNNSGGVSNTLIAYPNQLTSGAAPTTYSPLFSSNGTIGWTLRNLQILNATTILKTEGLCGHARVENITCTPFGGIMFHLDRVSEKTYFSNINVWKWGGTITDSNDLATYNAANSTLFKLGFVDGLDIKGVGTYNVGTTFHLYNNGSGSPWVNIESFTCDNNVRAIIIDDCNVANFSNGIIQGDNEISYDGSCPLDITSSVSTGHARANFSNIDFYAAAHAIHVGAAKGEFTFSNISVKTFLDQTGASRYPSNAIRGAAIIDEGAGAIVHLNNVARGHRRQWEHIFGPGETLTVDGKILPNRGTDVSSEITGWDDKAGWTGTTTNMTNTTGGIIFDMLTTATEVTYPLGTNISNEGIGVIEVILNQSFAQAVASGAEFSLIIIDGSGNEITRMWDSSFVPHYEQGYKFIWPFFCDPNVTTNKIKIRFGGLTTGTGTITMTGLKIWRPDRHYITQAFIDAVYGTERFATTRGKVVSMENHNKVMLANSIPTGGTWVVGDKIKDSSPTAGDAAYWVCTAAGTPGTWVKYGTLVLDGSATWDPGSLVDGAGETSAGITVTGAALGDFVEVAAPYDLQGITCNAYVSSANTVKIRIQNETVSTIDLVSGTWKVRVKKST